MIKTMKEEKQILEFCQAGKQATVWLRATTFDEFLQSGVFNLKIINNDGTLGLPFDVGNNDVIKLVVNDNPSSDKLQVERFVAQTVSYVRRDTGENISYTRYRSNVDGVHRWTGWVEVGAGTVYDIYDGAVTLEKLSPDLQSNIAKSIFATSELEGRITTLFHTTEGTHPYGRFFLKKNYNYRFVFEETGYTSPLYKALINNKDRATLVASTTGGEFLYRPTEDVEAYLSLYSGSEGDVTVTVTSLPVLQKEIADNLAFEAMPVLPAVVTSKYTKYDDGVPTGGASYFTQYVYDVAAFVGRVIKVNSYSSDSVLAVVAFYSSGNISADTYLKESSVQAAGGYDVVDVVIPEGAAKMVVTHRNVDDFTKPVVLMKSLVEKPCSSVANKVDISALANVNGVILSSSYVRGYYSTSTGVLSNTNSADTVVSEMFIAVEADTEYVVKNIDGYKLAVYFYNAEKGFVKNKKWFSDGNSFVTESDTAYVRIALRKDDIVLAEIPTASVVKNQDESLQIRNDYAVALMCDCSKGGYVKYEDGSSVTAGTYWKYAKVDVRGLKDIEVTGNWYDGVVAAIAFYTEDGVYLKDASVAGSRGESTKSAAVPTNAAYAICSSAELTPVIRTHSIGAVVDAIPTKLIDPLRALYNPFVGKPLYHHLNQEQVSAIPAQSLYDIAYAKALGFSVIEANVHKCADGVYVTKHGSSGKLGAGLVFAEGCGITADTAFGSVTSADLRAYVTYDTPLPQYAGHIPTLDEFCAECKRLGMKILLQVIDDEVLNIARTYFADSDIIAYGIKSRGDFKGLITTFQSVDDSTTVESVLNICDSFGKPYVFGGFWSSSMSDDKVKEITNALHTNGYLAGAAYAETLAIRRLAGLGVDMFASMADVNLFDAGNVNNVFSFEKFDIEFGNVTLENGVANMSQGAVLSLSDTAFENNHGKVLVSLLFDGELSVKFGNIKAYTVASDGTEWVTMARVIGRNSKVIGFEAKIDTVIKGVKVLSSVVI